MTFNHGVRSSNLRWLTKNKPRKYKAYEVFRCLWIYWVFGAIAQFIALGEISDMWEARKIIAKGENLKVYNPVDADKWEEAYNDFCKIVK